MDEDDDTVFAERGASPPALALSTVSVAQQIPARSFYLRLELDCQTVITNCDSCRLNGLTLH